MSSHAANELGTNAVMCYFPWLPYYQRYQIGFDILLPPDAQADPSVARQSQRLIHVRLYFPDGFTCNPAKFGGMPHPASSRGGAPHFLLQHPHLRPAMYPAYVHTTTHYHRHVAMHLPQPMMQQERDARVVVYVVNGQPGEVMAIDDTPYDVIPQCKGCGEFHRVPEHIHNKPSQGVPKRKPSQQPHKQSAHYDQHPSASGIPAQRDTSYAPSHTASERAATDHKISLQKEDKTNLTQQMADELQHGTHEAVQGIQCINETVTSASNQPTVIVFPLLVDYLDEDGHNNNGNVAQDNNNPNADPEVDNDNWMED